jgi:hypothetical protein
MLYLDINLQYFSVVILIDTLMLNVLIDFYLFFLNFIYLFFFPFSFIIHMCIQGLVHSQVLFFNKELSLPQASPEL